MLATGNLRPAESEAGGLASGARRRIRTEHPTGHAAWSRAGASPVSLPVASPRCHPYGASEPRAPLYGEATHFLEEKDSGLVLPSFLVDEDAWPSSPDGPDDGASSRSGSPRSPLATHGDGPPGANFPEPGGVDSAADSLCVAQSHELCDAWHPQGEGGTPAIEQWGRKPLETCHVVGEQEGPSQEVTIQQRWPRQVAGEAGSRASVQSECRCFGCK